MYWKAGQVMSKPEDWIAALMQLGLRFAYLGFGPDLSVLTVVEQAGSQGFIARLADAAK